MKTVRLFAVITVLLALLLSLNVFAMSEDMPLVMDEADILSESQEEELSAKLQDISKRAKCHVVVLIVNSVGMSSVEKYAENYFNFCGYGWGDDKSGILLLLSMEGRDYAIYTYGKAYDEFDGTHLDELEDKMLPHFAINNFYEGFLAYADVCEDTLIYSFDVVGSLVIAVIIGAVISFIILGTMSAKLKTVRPQRAASNYVRHGSFNLTKDLDIYLYRNITRVRRANNSSSSSRGGSRSSGGGRSGKF